MDTDRPTTPPIGLPSQSNWVEFNRPLQEDRVCYGGSEYPLYSDVKITGEIAEGLGPYALLNSLPLVKRNAASEVLVLRMFIFEDFRYSTHNQGTLKTDVARFHGGTLAEEIAALTSLGLGIRMKSGDANRYFDGSDPLGRPKAFMRHPAPTLMTNLSGPIIPLPSSVYLNEIQTRLTSVPAIKADLYVDLVRAARLYQDALWISETEPHLAWLLFVSSIEIAANAHFSSSGSPADNLRELKGGLANLLIGSGGEELLTKVAHELKDLFGSTKKFLMFCERFMPPAPPIRPSAGWSQIEWTERSLKRILNKVYELRSKALHAGIPFPTPMCRQPDQYDEGCPSELAITSLAVNTLNGTWVPEDAPIALHTFHYIVRGVLLNWWDQIAQADVAEPVGESTP